MSYDKIVRDAHPNDIDEILRLLDLMHGGDRKSRASASEVELFQQILSQEGRRILVAENERKVVGTVDVIVTSNLSRDGAPWAMVENLVVDPTLRGRGIGRALMSEAIEFARSKRCYKVQLVSSRSREVAQGLYRSLGFDAPVDGFRQYLKSVSLA